MTQANTKNGPVFTILSQSLRKLHLDTYDTSPNGDIESDININVDVNLLEGHENLIDVCLELQVNTVSKDKKVFDCHIKYGGVAECKSISEAVRKEVGLVSVPSLLYPYVRQIVGMATASAGFPAFLLEPMDFDTMFDRSAETGIPNDAWQLAPSKH